MADELETSELSVWSLFGPQPELLVTELSVWSLFGPPPPPPPPPPPSTRMRAGVHVALGRYATEAFE